MWAYQNAKNSKDSSRSNSPEDTTKNTNKGNLYARRQEGLKISTIEVPTETHYPVNAFADAGSKKNNNHGGGFFG